MNRLSMLSRGVAISGLIALGAVPALAEGKADRAREAIAQARAKVSTADKIGASSNTPALAAHADAALATAEEDLKAGHKEDAFDAATHASELADIAIGQSQKDHAQAMNAQRAAAADNAQAAQSANQRADAAQQAAADANARASDAQMSAAAAQEQAAAAAATPAPAPTTTTVTTHTTAHGAHVVKVPAGSTTTTKVTTAPAQTPGQ